MRIPGCTACAMIPPHRHIEGITVHVTETKVASEIRAVLAKHRVQEFALLETLKALPREDASRLAHELRACANDEAPITQAMRQVAIRPWSFLTSPSDEGGGPLPT